MTMTSFEFETLMSKGQFATNVRKTCEQRVKILLTIIYTRLQVA